MSRSRQTSRSGSTTSRNVPPDGYSVPSSSETIVYANVPPGRTSIVIVERGVVMSRGPNQRATCSGSVQACQTSSRGASKTRVIVNSWSTDGVSAIALLLHRSEMPVEPVEAAFEELPVPRQPVGCVLEGTSAQPRRPPPRRAGARDQPGAFEHLQVRRARGTMSRPLDRLRLTDQRRPPRAVEERGATT